VVDRLNRDIVRIITSPAQRERIVVNFGIDPIGGSAEDFARAMKADGPRADELAELLRISGYKPE
jgi:hypothetical protein